MIGLPDITLNEGFVGYWFVHLGDGDVAMIDADSLPGKALIEMARVFNAEDADLDEVRNSVTDEKMLEHIDNVESVILTLDDTDSDRWVAAVLRRMLAVNAKLLAESQSGK